MCLFTLITIIFYYYHTTILVRLGMGQTHNCVTFFHFNLRVLRLVCRIFRKPVANPLSKILFQSCRLMDAKVLKYDIDQQIAMLEQEVEGLGFVKKQVKLV